MIRYVRKRRGSSPNQDPSNLTINKKHSQSVMVLFLVSFEMDKRPQGQHEKRHRLKNTRIAPEESEERETIPKILAQFNFDSQR